MGVRTLTINGTLVNADDDQTVLSAATEAGVRIPTLCHLDGVSEAAACRLCLVEVGGSSKLQPACATAVTEGMEVRTDTARLRAYRKMILELLFAERNHVCAVCVANGGCELQDLAAELGMDHVRYPYQSPKLAIDASHARFGMDHNRCILCTRCVRVCDEVEGTHTRDVAGRGTHCLIITDLGEPWGESTSCTSCGKCVQACPTGALYRRGSTVAEMRHDRDQLTRLIAMRETKQWPG